MSEEATTVDVGGSGSGIMGFFLNVGCSLGVFGLVVLLMRRLKVAELPRAEEWKPHAKYWAIALCTVLALPYSVSVYVFDELTLALVACLLPVYESVYAVCTPGTFVFCMICRCMRVLTCSILLELHAQL